MANYSNLKAAIAAAIKQNGNQEITGQVLQDVLTSMVSVIGANYTFAGVATPSTNPGTPDQNVVYMASQGGTYTNFGGIQLPAGISLLMWNGAWTSNTVMYGDGGVFDISLYKSSGGTLATFADLAAALDGGNNIPASARNGGMSVKFVQSSDNKYVQYRLMSQSFSTNVANWQGVDDKPTAGSNNLVKSGGISNAIQSNSQSGFGELLLIDSDSWELGSISAGGSPISSDVRIRTANYITLSHSDFSNLDNRLFVEISSVNSYQPYLLFYDFENLFISGTGYITESQYVNIPENATKVKVLVKDNALVGSYTTVPENINNAFKIHRMYVKNDSLAEEINYVNKGFDILSGNTWLQKALNFSDSVVRINSNFIALPNYNVTLKARSSLFYISIYWTNTDATAAVKNVIATKVTDYEFTTTPEMKYLLIIAQAKVEVDGSHISASDGNNIHLEFVGYAKQLFTKIVPVINTPTINSNLGITSGASCLQNARNQALSGIGELLPIDFSAFELGSISAAGQPIASTVRIRSNGFIQILNDASGTATLKVELLYNYVVNIFFYDYNGSFISNTEYISTDATVTIPASAAKVKILTHNNPSDAYASLPDDLNASFRIRQNLASNINLFTLAQNAGGGLRQLPLKVGSYNVWAYGTLNEVAAEDQPRWIAQFKEYMNGIINGLFLFTQEDRVTYTAGGETINAYNTLYSQFYNYHFVSEMSADTGGTCNGIYSKLPLSNARTIKLEVDDNVNDIHYKRGYAAAEVSMNGETILLVSIHGGIYGTDNLVREFTQLKAITDTYDYVIIAGDSNDVGGTALKSVFVNNGYQIANFGYWGTKVTWKDYADASFTKAIDTFVTKGFNINSFVVEDNAIGDHNPIVSSVNMI